MASNNPFSTLLHRESLTARLAILQPAADKDAPIELTLTDAVLKDTSYECISYDRSSKTASAADNNTSVTVDGVPQDIPKQLASALLTFRRKERTRTLWADVLVGRTLEERSAQAAVQRQVLEGAERTLCWLGPDKDGSDATSKAFSTISEMGRRFEDACRAVGLGPDDRLTTATIQQMSGIRQRLLDCGSDDLNSFDFAVWREIYDVFGAPYWKSAQCVADIVLAKAPIVVRGRSNIRWHAYIAASRGMPLYQAKFFQVPLLPHVVKGFEIANQIEIAERRRRLGESVELLPMVQTARDCEPRDVRESVFAMLLIATPSRRVDFHGAGPQPLPAIDYAKTPQQVFAEAARYSVLERQDLMLWYGERPPCARRLKGLPSWVPDFGAVPPKTGTAFNPNGGMRQWWDMIKPEAARKPITVGVDNVLHLQARPLDRVVHVSPVFNAGNARHLCFAEFQKLHETMSSAPTSTSAPNPFANEPPADTAQRFWRTLLLNAGGTKPDSATLHDTAAPPSSLGAHFESLLAEERILDGLDCSMHELTSPANVARLRAAPELLALVPRCGRAAPYEDLLVRHAVGRRFFRTAGGRFGMSCVEDVVAADPSLLPAERENRGEDGEGEGERRRPDLGRLMSDPLARIMSQQFQQYLNERDPSAARVHAKAMRGAIPEMGEEALGRTDGGVGEGDLVVACVGGFFPYILRPRREEADAEATANTGEGAGAGEGEEDGSSNSQPTEAALEDSSTYEFVGECYLHGAMQGEDFQATRLFGQKYFDVDTSKLVDINIV
ncbi:hypothetical protein F4781DRAFT_429649 [Annulohypoxylon bovei var. microspora]|nr:hypothetical protein F4781DRAFT_429649 [Annulohypoxylon bovei var. microspora]